MRSNQEINGQKEGKRRENRNAYDACSYYYVNLVDYYARLYYIYQKTSDRKKSIEETGSLLVSLPS